MSEVERWRRVDAVLWRRVLDDAVLLSGEQADPFALAGGAHLWGLLARSRTVAELTGAICEATGADPASVEIGVRQVLAELEGRDAVERDRG